MILHLGCRKLRLIKNLFLTFQATPDGKLTLTCIAAMHGIKKEPTITFWCEREIEPEPESEPVKRRKSKKKRRKSSPVEIAISRENTMENVFNNYDANELN